MSIQDSRTAALRDAIVSWIAGHEDEMGSMQLRLSGISGSSLLLQANSKRIHMSVPSSRDEVFLVTAADPEPDPSFDAALLILNERFERLRPEGDALFVAMEYLLTALKKLQAKPVSQSDYESADDGVDEDNDVDEYIEADEVDYGYDMASLEDASRPSSTFMELRHRGFLYAMTIEAKQQCEAARRQFQNAGVSLEAARKNTESALAWCIVKADPGALLIHIKMQIGGIMCDDVAAASLGLSLDLPMRISLVINKDLWCKEHYSSSLKIDACYVKAVFDHNKDSQDEGASQKPNAGASEGWDKDPRHKFGEEIFIPELVHCFFKYMERKDEIVAKSSDVLKELQEFTAIRNPIVGLIQFLAARLSALPNWCIACWDTLPCKMGRLRTCEKDLCLYRFEELGIGTTILQEVHKSRELMDFEISLAIAAASSRRDVFEPFPAFLLEKEEIRDRSGWFSKKSKPNASLKDQTVGFDSKQKSHHENSNKSFGVLRSILNAYPSLEEMQCYNDEVDLKKMLARAWHRFLDAHKDEVQNEWRLKAELPYDVLRFLISSNRLTLCSLEGLEQLPVEDSIYQFAVLHDNPEKEAHFEKRRAEMGGSFFAFHGSPAGNWFSILRNGLRSLSNTRYMSTGAAYGAGIYTASHMGTSVGYATMGNGWKHGRMFGSFSVLAICEIVNGSLVSNNITYDVMVVRPECEQDILIRYILVLPGGMAGHYTLSPASNQSGNQTQLRGPGGKRTDLWTHHSHLRDLYYSKQQKEWGELRKARWLSLSTMCKIEEEEERRLQAPFDTANPDSKSMPSCHAMPGCMQAIQKELKNISSQINLARRRKLQKDANLSILAHIDIDVPDETNLQRWHVDLSQDLFKESPLLFKDLLRLAKQKNQECTSVKLECVFPDTFPMAPPFIRVMSPRFKFHTGHITVGGSICMELLTESGWSPAFCFESVLVQIVSAMMEGGARLDFNAFNEYSVQEARAAFDRVARDHGWIKGNK